MEISSNHKYSLEGKQFDRSVTEVVKAYMPEFPKELVARKVANRDGLEVDDVLAKWEMNGKISSGYGTAVHKAIEYWLTYKENPKQLSEVVDSFKELWTTNAPVSSEIAVYDEVSSVCGTIDILEVIAPLQAKIHDVKTNVDIYASNKQKMKAPFDDLYATKINEYRLQLSIYKHLMELLGWKIESIELWHYEKKWEVIELEPIKSELIKQIL